MDISKIENAMIDEKDFNAGVKDFSEEVQTCFKNLKEGFSYIDIRKDANNIKIYFKASICTDTVLTLLNTSSIEQDYAGIDVHESSLQKKENLYLLSVKGECIDNEEAIELNITFADAKAEINIYNAVKTVFLDTPWEYLCDIAKEIANKPVKILNSKEKESLTLITELAELAFDKDSDIEESKVNKSPDFYTLKKYLTQYNHDEILPLFEKLEQEFLNNKKREALTEKIISTLNTIKYEPLWRELFNIINETQKGFPSATDKTCPSEVLTKTRKEIQRLMEEQGYSGTYPDFVKTGEIKGMRVATSYDKDYYIGTEKNVAYHIHCGEEYFCDNLDIYFVCGTELLKEGENKTDIYSCCFNANGRKIKNHVFYENNSKATLAQKLQIAVKKAEIKELTKEDKKAADITELCTAHNKLNIFSRVLKGILFGFLFTLGIFLLTVAKTLIFDTATEITSNMQGMPWLLIFFFSTIVFIIVSEIKKFFNLK